MWSTAASCTLKREIRNAFASPGFFLGFGIMLICFLGMSVPEWIISTDWGDEFRQSALQQSISGIFFGGVMLLLPFCACTPYATRQVEEIRSSVMQWKWIRGSTVQYAAGKIVATAMSGGSAVALAFALHAIIWNLIAIPCDPIAYPYHEIMFDPASLYVNWYSYLYGLPMYCSMTAGIFLSGAVWATVALAITVWVPDRLLTVTIPACIYYLLSASVFNRLLGWNLPHPATLYNDALTIKMAISSLLEYAGILVIACVGYFVGLKRRAQYE